MKACTCFPQGSEHQCNAPQRCAFSYLPRNAPKAAARDATEEAVKRFEEKGGHVQQCDAKPARYAKTPQRRK